MNKFDFSKYDHESPAISEKPQLIFEKKQINKFDFSKYDIPELNKKDESIPKGPIDTFFTEFNKSSEKFKNLEKSAIKGGIEGIGKLGRMLGPIGEDTSEQITQNLNKILPNEEGYLEKGVRKTLNEAPSFLSFPGGGSIQRTIAAGFLGEGAKELGLPEWAQSALELSAFIGPDITRKLLSSGKDKEIIEFAKKMGMTDEEITPLLQSGFKKKWLSKLSPKGGRTQSILERTKNALSNAYKGIQKGEQASKEISSESRQKLLSSFYDQLVETPANVRELVLKDLDDLLKKPITGDTLMNFYADINSNFGKNTKQLFNLKPYIKEAISSISPELAKDFESINKLFSKYYDISSKLKPTLASQMLSGGEALAALHSIVTLNFGQLGVLFGERAARELSREMLTNPRLQQIFPKIIEALNQNKFSAAKKLLDSFGNDLKKTSPQIYSELKSIDKEDLQNLTSQEE